MVADGPEAPKASVTNRPRHQVTRSISELSSPIRLHRHNPAHHLRKERERDDRTSAPQSAAPPLQERLSLDGYKSEGVTPNRSPNSSRRASVQIARSEDAAATTVSGPAQIPDVGQVTRVPRKASGDAERKLEQQRATARANGLKQSLSDLASFSNTTTRRLDDSYYSALEKLGSLQSRVAALGALAEAARSATDAFRAESETIAGDAAAQLDTFAQLAEQQRARIETLVDRVRSGREQVGVLGRRVGAVRARVEGWERADRAWQERTRRRMKVVWIVFSVVLALLALLFVTAQYVDVPGGLEETARVANESLRYLRDASGLGEASEEGSQGLGHGAKLNNTDGRLGIEEILNRARRGTRPQGDDERLRVFDEL